MGKFIRFRLVATRTVEGERRGAPENPPGFKGIVGPYKAVSSRAVKLNEKQSERGFHHYVFCPEPIIDREAQSS